MNNPEFKVITKDLLDQIGDYYYSGSRKLKEGDLIMSGYTMYYCKLGLPPSSYDSKNASLVLNLFVWCGITKSLYLLYRQK
jgi:hypothetical protein